MILSCTNYRNRYINPSYYNQINQQYEHVPVRLSSKIVDSTDLALNQHKNHQHHKHRHHRSNKLKESRSILKQPLTEIKLNPSQMDMNVLIASRSRRSHSKFIKDFKNSFDQIDSMNILEKEVIHRSRSKKMVKTQENLNLKYQKSTDSLDLIEHNKINNGSNKRQASIPSDSSPEDTVIIPFNVYKYQSTGEPILSQDINISQEFIKKYLINNDKENIKPFGPFQIVGNKPLFKKYDYSKPSNLLKSKRCNFTEDSSGTDLENCADILNQGQVLTKSKSKIKYPGQEKMVMGRTYVKRVKKSKPPAAIFLEPDTENLMSTLKARTSKLPFIENTPNLQKPNLNQYKMDTTDPNCRQKVNEFIQKNQNYLVPENVVPIVNADNLYDKLYVSDVSIGNNDEASTIIDMEMFKVQSEKAFFNDNHFTCKVETAKKRPNMPSKMYVIREQIYPSKKIEKSTPVDSIRQIPVPLDMGSFSEYETFVNKVFDKALENRC